MASLLSLVKKAIQNNSPARQFKDMEEVKRTIGFRNLFSQVRELVNDFDVPMEDIYHYLTDIYFDAGILYAIIVSNGRLFRADIRVGNDDSVTLGDLIPVTQMFVPSMNRSFQTTVIVRTADESYRWFSVSNTAILNRVGELDSRALFDSFVNHAKRTGEYPYRTFHHQGVALRTGQADYLARDGYCYLTSGLYDVDSPLAQIERKAFANNPERWGESIGFIPVEDPEIVEVDGLRIPVFKSGVNYEISTCQERDASAWFTSSLLASEEAIVMDGQVRSSLRLLMQDAEIDDDAANKLLSGFETLVDSVNERAADPGVIARAGADSGDEPGDDVNEFVIDDSVVKEIVDRVLADERLATVNRSADDEAPDLTAVSERIDALVTRLDTAEGVIVQNFADLLGQVRDAVAIVGVEVDRANDMPSTSPTTVVYRPSNGEQQPRMDQPEGEPAGLANVPTYPGAD